ncbi:MAG TPA: tRNA guanosine(34) transglycosylase Tgt [Verrucomicrobia bacterium]|nr:tRNA guanosine(34) transglycosylase Tgt [Verrucomicrobiota bacterium]|tara:strand:+ start:103 stop:1248 length:1146 start_codon:yes stop_codon:yes gene_type:complete
MATDRFEILKRDVSSQARCGRLQTAHGVVETPVFMPVGTQATVKAMSPLEMEELGCEILLGNTYHLNDRPGADLIERRGGLHSFMGWDGSILTDSGGYQVFSLGARNTITDEGVSFKSHSDGRQYFIGPKESMEIQRKLGSDIAMVFDECPPYPCKKDYACQVVRRTIDWAAICRDTPRAEGQIVFGIVQGGVFADLRESCAKTLVEMDFEGYAIGGVSVGEPEELILRGVDDTTIHLPEQKPRYLMGVGEMAQMVESVARGVDMFDCVMPTRQARNGTVSTRRGRYPVKAALYSDDERPLEEGCSCYACKKFTRSYIRHLLNVGEILGLRLITLHNLHCYLEMMREIRSAIEQGSFDQFRNEFHAAYQTVLKEHVQSTKE